MSKLHRSMSLLSLGLATVSLGGPTALPAQEPAQNGAPGFGPRCAALAGLSRGVVVSGEAEPVPAGTAAPAAPGGSAAAPAPVLPEHCRVRGTIAPRVGHAGRTFGIGFELRLPAEWNGRFLFQGGGGMDGVVLPAVGTIANSAKGPALSRGFAVVSTDAGHSGSPVDATFGLDQQARID